MILIDYSQVFISNLHAQLGRHLNAELNPDIIRHMVLNSIRMYNHRHSAEFGEIVICVDSSPSWRKGVFPYYKAHRKKAREESEIDWDTVFKSLNLVKEELEDFFPYRVVYAANAEADDIIGTLSHKYGQILNSSDAEKILILSSDKDFIQLHTYANVSQYDPIRKRWIKHNDPSGYLIEHTLKGDAGDGIPNVLSVDASFVESIRQKPVTQGKLKIMMETISKNEPLSSQSLMTNYNRNKILIDLSCTPNRIQEEILNKYHSQAGKGREKLFNYFIKYKLKNLTECIGEF
jgi:hypothetical protein